MAQLFALDKYKPSQFFTLANQLDPILTKNQINISNNYKPQIVKAKIYLTTVSLMQGSCRATIPVEKIIHTQLNPIHDRLMALFQGPNEFEKTFGYTTSFEGWQQVFMGNVLQSDGTLIIRFSEEILNPESSFYLGNFNNECGLGVWEQIYLTVKEDARVKYVVFTINDNASVWNDYITKRQCPPIKGIAETAISYTQAEKQCTQKQ